MSLNLEGVTWHAFFIEDIAKIISGRDIYDAERFDGKIPYISSTAKNNGVGHFVGNHNSTLESNCLSVNRNGSVGYSFFHPYKGLYSNDCRKLRPVVSSVYTPFFLSNQISLQRHKYSYGYKMGTGRLERQKIMLPANHRDEPDWQLMESYTQTLMDRKKVKYLNFCRKELANLRLQNIAKIEDKEWQEFFIGGKEGVFTISSTSSGIDKNKLNTGDDNEIEKTTPYITRTNEQNGINLFIPQSQQEKFKRNAGGVITIGLDTQTIFYQPYGFFTGQNIQILHHKSLNKWNSLFLIPLLKIQMEKFNWGGNGATLGRLRRTKVMLPTKENGSPDFEYMGQYMMNLEHRKRNQYIDHIQRSNEYTLKLTIQNKLS
ncbi:restriction endonuclease subunit S [Psychrobacter sanguinis]|uniref:restriction endonuclease subunit S n=1 Tax=Psychrobacter sanguinis TaxID=861445 RepID=UPI0028B0E3CC|nr:restriction endonuclease subunit S [Psychrobacter sanguinis]